MILYYGKGRHLCPIEIPDEVVQYYGQYQNQAIPQRQVILQQHVNIQQQPMTLNNKE